MTTDKDTRIIVKKTTRATLKGLGRKGESYDMIINRLIKTEKETIMKWTHSDIRHTMKTLYDLNPTQGDLENVAEFINWEQNIEDGHARVQRAVEEYLADKEAGE